MLGFSRLDGLLRIFVGLWLAVWEHHLETGKGLSPLVSALLFFPNDSCRGAPCRCYASMPLLSVLRKSLKSWLPQTANKKQGKGVKATHSAVDACVAVGVSTREDAWIASGER